MIERQDLPSAEEKEKALEWILQSDTFARADQLKKFLRFVCELEIAGRAGDLTEYRVGVEALGKPINFSPVDDTSVRNRAYALRHKLETYYTEENREARIRIEFQKGTYIPRFVKTEPGNVATLHAASEAEATQGLAPVEAPGVAPQFEQGQGISPVATRANSGWVRWRLPVYVSTSLLAGVILGVVVGAVIVERVKPVGPASRIDPIIREAWGPLLEPNANVLICVATAPKLTLLPFDVTMEGRFGLPTLEAPTALIPWYLRYHRLASGQRLYMSANVNSPHFGDALGALTAAQVLTAAGVPFQFLPERLVPSATLSARNVIFFGAPHTSDAAFTLLERGRFQFVYDAHLKDQYLVESVPGQTASRRFVPRRDEREDRVEAFGLITIRPSPGDVGGTKRIALFSANPSAAAAAALEFFSSTRHLRELKARLKKEGYSGFPPSYQVVVRCKLDNNTPTEFSYETHVVLH